MPKIDANVQEGSIGQWLKEVGHWVESGETIVEIITDKASFELESECAGFLRSRTAAEKSVVPVGYVIALLSDQEAEPLPDVDSENEELMRRYRESLLFGVGEPAAPPGSTGAAAEAATAPRRDGRPKATPAARKLARRERVDLEDVKVPEDGVIRESDVVSHLRGRAKTQDGGADA